MTAKVTLGRSVWIITIFTNILLIGTLVFAASEIISGNQQVLMAILFVIILITLVVTFFLKPRCLILTDDALIVRFLLHRTWIVREDIEAVELREKYKDYVDIRTFGSGGVWGYLGKFHNNGVGYYTAYAGDMSQAFYVRLKSGKTYLLSCNSHKDFIKELTKGKKSIYKDLP